MKSYMNVFIIKLKKKIEMYSAFLIYIVGGTFFDSIDRIAVFKNSEDIYPCYFFIGMPLFHNESVKCVLKNYLGTAKN